MSFSASVIKGVSPGLWHDLSPEQLSTNRVQPSPLTHLLRTLWSHPLVTIFSHHWSRPDMNCWPGGARSYIRLLITCSKTVCLQTVLLKKLFRKGTDIASVSSKNFLNILFQNVPVSLICFTDLLLLVISRILRESRYVLCKEGIRRLNQPILLRNIISISLWFKFS